MGKAACEYLVEAILMPKGRSQCAGIAEGRSCSLKARDFRAW
jgi:hypothetical protein